MAPLVYVVVPVSGLRKSERRAIAFLECDGDARIDAKATFDALDDKRERELLTRFDYWISEKRQDDYFHGWPNELANKECFCFKWKDKRSKHRLYGVLLNPKPKHKPEFRVCILASHGTKQEWETDPQHKALANMLRVTPNVIAAIKAVFPDRAPGDESWRN